MSEVETHVESYMDAALKRGQRFAIKVGGGRWVFGIVRDYEDVGPFVYYRINSMLTGASTFSIGAGAADTYNRLRDSNNYDIFWEEAKDFLLQTFMGITPPDVRLFVRYPAGIPVGSLNKIKATVINAEAKGYIDGNEWGSPFEVPTSRLELMFPKEVEVDFGLFNPTGVTLTPQLSMFIRRLKVTYYDKNNQTDLKIIQNIIDGNLKARWWSPSVQVFEYDCKEKLGVESVEVKWR